MNGSTTMILAVCLTMICLVCLVLTGFLVWWTTDSASRRSISAAKQTERAMAGMERMIGQGQAIAEIQAKLTETLLLGRASPETQRQLVTENTLETSTTPDDLWRDLPAGARDAMIREALEDELSAAASPGTWPNLWEQLRPPSANGRDPDEPVPAPDADRSSS